MDRARRRVGIRDAGAAPACRAHSAGTPDPTLPRRLDQRLGRGFGRQACTGVRVVHCRGRNRCSRGPDCTIESRAAIDAGACRTTRHSASVEFSMRLRTRSCSVSSSDAVVTPPWAIQEAESCVSSASLARPLSARANSTNWVPLIVPEAVVALGGSPSVSAFPVSRLTSAATPSPSVPAISGASSRMSSLRGRTLSAGMIIVVSPSSMVSAGATRCSMAASRSK